MGRGYDSFHRRLYFFNYYISPPSPPFFCSKGCKHPFTNLSVFLSCCRGTKEGVGICFMVFTRKLFPFFFPPPRPHSLRAIRRLLTFEVRRNLGEFVNFSSFLSQIDSKGGGEKRGEATDVVERKGWKEGRNEANKYNRRGIRTKRGARSPMKEIYDCLLIKKGREGGGRGSHRIVTFEEGLINSKYIN